MPRVVRAILNDMVGTGVPVLVEGLLALNPAEQIVAIEELNTTAAGIHEATRQGFLPFIILVVINYLLHGLIWYVVRRRCLANADSLLGAVGASRSISGGSIVGLPCRARSSRLMTTRRLQNRLPAGMCRQPCRSTRLIATLPCASVPESGLPLHVVRTRDLPPESLAVPVHFGLGFDLDVAIDSRLARQPQVFFYAPGAKNELAPAAVAVEDPLRAEVFDSLGDVHAAARTLPETHAIDVLVNSRVELDPLLNGHLSQVGPRFDFNFFFLSDEFDFGHGKLIPLIWKS